MKYVRVVIFIAIVVLVVVSNLHFGWTDLIASGELSRMLEDMVAVNPLLASGAFVAVTAVGSAILALPGYLFSLAAGAIFGPVAGTLLCWIAMWLGACLAFAVSRYLLKDALKPRLAKNQTLDRLLFSGARQSDLFVLAVTRLVPIIPFSLQNLAYGVTDIGFKPYALYTALFLLPGTAGFAASAAAVVHPEVRVACIVAAVALFALSFLAALLLRKKANL